MASSLLASGPAAAQSQPAPEQRPAAATPGSPALGSRSSGTGRDQFIAPVMGIQIQGDGLNLPEAEEEDPAKAPAKPAAEPKPETKEPEPRSTGR